MKRKIEILLLSLILTVVVTVGISSATKGLVIQPGDVNGDGDINAKDAVMLAQYLAGWDVVLGGDSHTVVIDAAVPATCTQTGLTEGKHCSDCGMILVKQQIVPMTEHDYKETVVQPTTTSEGYTLCKCKICGYEKKKNIIPAVDSNGLAVEVETLLNTCVIIGIGTCTDTEINIPQKISGYTVIGIADRAFSQQTQITSIKLPNTLKNIGARAFYGCTGLTEIMVPSSVVSIGQQIFYKCDNLETVYYDSNFSPTTDQIFLNGPSIKTVIFGGTTIPSRIAYGCSNIETIMISKEVKQISYDAFAKCDNVNNFHISDFESWLNVYLNSDTSHPFNASQGNLYVDGELAEEIIIPDSINTIKEYAFMGCNSLTNVIIPDSVMKIHQSAFYNCNNLISVSIPDSVLTIEDSVFKNCGSLANVMLPDSVTSIGDSAFEGCGSLESIVIPGIVTSIGDSAFYNCSSLTSISIPDSVTSIGNCAFYNCSSLASAVIPDGVTVIGDSLFSDCTKLTSIMMPDGITRIGSGAFYNCSDLAIVVIPEGVTNIGAMAFYNCSNLISLVIYDGVTYIGAEAFYYCGNLETIYFGGDSKDWKKNSSLANNSKLASVTRYYYSATQPTETGNYWHYVDGKPTPW